jgi:predicted component of type VI protein secretion system
MKSIWSGLFRVASICALCLASTGFAQTLSLEKKTFSTAEDIQVSFTAPTDFAPNAWVAVVPSEVKHGNTALNNEKNIGYQYLKGRASGVLVFKAPAKPGAYDFRLTSEDNNDRGKEVASVSFTVTVSVATITIDKTTFAPGEDIPLKFTAPASYAPNAWIGIVPSKVKHTEAQNDENNRGYDYLKSRTSGTMVLKAPAEPGAYDLRLSDEDDHERGHETYAVSFMVK